MTAHHLALALLVVSCRASAPTPVPGSRAEAVSLLGDTLVRPTLDSAAAARMERQLDEARAVAVARPNDAEAHIWVARRLGYLGRYNEAIATLSDALRRFPADARLYRHRGHRYITIRRFDDAIGDLSRAATLMAGRPDEVEPDGQPNARNIPIGSLQSNVWYHLALAHYLKGDWPAAVRAARAGIAVSGNPDRLVSQTHWLYMALRRDGRHADAARTLEPIRDDFDIVENQSYYQLLQMYKRGIAPAALDETMRTGIGTPSNASLAYGVANWFLYTGDTARAISAFRQIVRTDQWASFGVIAAEADLARLAGRR